MNIPELLIGLFGGGVIGQLIVPLLTARPNRRQINAQAFGTEVAALEQTIRLLRESMESEIKNHAEEREAMRKEIRGLNHRIAGLNESIAALRAENAQLRSDITAARSIAAVR